MSVIPFHRSEAEDSYTDSRTEFSISGNVVLILDLDAEQLKDGSRDGNATYNLRVGSEYRDYLDEGSTSIGEGDEIVIGPGKTVVIKTLEDVSFPSSRYGLILPKVSLLQRGLSTVASKIDPGYHGNLAITLFNHSRSTERLKYIEQFCSLTLFEVIGQNSRPYDKSSKTLRGSRKKLYQKARDIFYQNIGIITIISFLFSTSLIVWRIWSFYVSLWNK